MQNVITCTEHKPMALGDGWECQLNDPGRCIDISKDGEPVHALDTLEWSELNLESGNAFYIPLPVRECAEEMHKIFFESGGS